jgi:hypothetical protein
MLLRDLRDLIEASSVQILVYKQQIHQLQKRLPPSIFLSDPSYAPYFWILTDVDYSQMHPMVRESVMYYRKGIRPIDEQTQDMLNTFLRKHGTIERRYLFLLSKFLAEKTQESLLVASEQREAFAKYCYDLLRKRTKNIRTKVKSIRKDRVRVMERERSKQLGEYNRLRVLQLQEPQFEIE